MIDEPSLQCNADGGAGMLLVHLPSVIRRLNGDVPTIIADLHCDSTAIVGLVCIPAGSTDHFWERHEGGDEMLVILSGDAVFTASDPAGALDTVTVRCGDIVLLRRGQAHRAQVRDDLRLLLVTPKAGNSCWTDLPDAQRRH